METIQALVLPFRKKMTQTQYLLHRDLIPAWDQEKDLCGILIEGEHSSIEEEIIKELNMHFGYKTELSNVLSLGVCAGDRSLSNTYYLYAVDLTKAKISDPKLNEPTDEHFWALEETLLESLDPQLIACYAKIQFLLNS